MEYKYTWGRIKDGILEYAPRTFKLEDGTGRTITNFFNSEKWMLKYGFKPIKDEQPNYDIETQYLVVDGHIEEDDCIRVVYIIKDAPIWEEPSEDITE